VNRPPQRRYPLILPHLTYTIGTAAALAGVPRTTLAIEVEAKRVPSAWVGRGRRVTGADLLAWMERETEKTKHRNG
jgi:excisionase family DNA binding protein